MSGTSPPPLATIGHVHLKVADLPRAVRFYTDVLGLVVTQYSPDPASGSAEAAFLAFGAYHHHLGLNTWESAGGQPPARGTMGLYHVAFCYPSRHDLAVAVRRVLDRGWPIDGLSDHGVSEAVYLRDPDGNGIELYRDRPVEDWPRTPRGALAMTIGPLSLDSLLVDG